MKEMKTLKFPNQDEPYEIVDAYARETLVSQQEQILDLPSVSYVDEKIAALVNSAPDTLDTLGELATAFQENEEVVVALDAAITNKADKSYVDSILPSVTTNDVGKFLRVQTDGTWAAETITNAEEESF